MKIILSGATGFIGKALVGRLLDAGHEVSVLTRGVGQVTRHPGGAVLVPWNGKDPGAWCGLIDAADAVINLAGENIAAKPWTQEQKHRILSSRLSATGAIVQAIQAAARRPGVFVNASAVGYYGHVPEGDVAESCSRGKGFLADVCECWEETALRAGRSGVRVVTARFGLVLENDGGVLERMLVPFRFFFGGPLGSGKQWIPWIHRVDLVEALIFLLNQGSFFGPVNVTAPVPRRMNEFCRVLGKALGRPSWIRTPELALKFFLGEMAEMVLNGARAVPVKLIAAGFKYQYPDLEPALSDILKKLKGRL